MKRGLALIAIVVAAAVVGWLAVFQGAAPCDALREQVVEIAKGKPPDVQKALMEASTRFAGVQCIGMAVRLKAGDTSALQVIVIER